MRLFSEHPADRIAEVLAPHLGASTADAVARHLCARHGVADGSADRGGPCQDYQGPLPLLDEACPSCGRSRRTGASREGVLRTLSQGTRRMVFAILFFVAIVPAAVALLAYIIWH